MGLSISISIRQVVQVQAKSALKQGALPTRHTSMRAWLGTKMANCVPIIRAEIVALIKAHIRDLI